MDATDGIGADAGCECVGYQAHDAGGHEDPAMTMNTLIHSVRYGGGLGVVGVFPPEDPGGRGQVGQAGTDRVRLGRAVVQGPARRDRPGTGEALQPRALPAHPRGQGQAIVPRVTRAPSRRSTNAYRHFDARDDGWTKVVLKPDSTQGKRRPLTSTGAHPTRPGRRAVATTTSLPYSGHERAQNYLHEVLPCEPRYEMCEHVIVHRPERGVGSILHPVGERSKDLLLEVRPLMRVGDGRDLIGAEHARGGGRGRRSPRRP